MEGVALQADQAIKHISGSLLSQKHQSGPGQFGGRRKKTKERGDKKTESRKREAILPPRPPSLSPFLVMRTGLWGPEFEIEL